VTEQVPGKAATREKSAEEEGDSVTRRNNMKKLKRPTKKELKPFWKALSIMERKFGEQVRELEDLLKETYGEHLMFFWCDGEIVGVGSEDRKMKLIHR